MSTKNQRLFDRWLALMNERRGRISIKTKPTKEEAKYIAGALTQASEEHLLLMLDWAFHGTDDYAKLLQGKGKGFDGRPPQEYLGLATLLKDKNLDKRLDLAEQWSFKPVIEPVSDGWLEAEALPALDRMVDSPESYETAYEWWAERRGRHPEGATADIPYVNALLKLREYRARGIT